MNAPQVTSEMQPPVATCYRIRPYYFFVGVACLALFLAAAVGSVCVALWNVDGSFGPHSTKAAIVFGSFWSCWVLLALWIIAAYFRERLFVTSDAITEHGCFLQRTIRISEAVRVVWRRVPQSGSIVVRSRRARIKIYLDNFTRAEQEELIAYVRTRFAPEIQQDWLRFTEKILHPARGQPPKRFRSLAAICGLVLLAFAGILGYCWGIGFGAHWLLLSLLNGAAGMWYLWRFIKSFASTSPGRSA